MCLGHSEAISSDLWPIQLDGLKLGPKDAAGMRSALPGTIKAVFDGALGPVKSHPGGSCTED